MVGFLYRLGYKWSKVEVIPSLADHYRSYVSITIDE